jgi:GntR family transcriptional regulator
LTIAPDRQDKDPLGEGTASVVAKGPIYIDIKRSILEEIENGALPVGARLTPELELAERYRVSRPTVRQAILELAREGVVSRRRGAGTVVMPRQRLSYPVGRLLSFTEEFAAGEGRTSSEVIRQEVIQADPELAVRLGVRVHTPVFQLERIRRVDGQPVARQRSSIADSKVHGIESLDFSQRSLYDTLRDTYRVVIASADERIQARTADRDDVRELAVVTGSAVFQVERRSFDSNGDLVEVVDSVYRSDRYEIRLSLNRS